MAILNRRTLLKTSAAAAALPLIGSPAFAQDSRYHGLDIAQWVRADGGARVQHAAVGRRHGLLEAQGDHGQRSSAKASGGYNGLSTNGSLRWPVQGPILISYGSPRTAELKWKGTLIGASEGTQVKAVAPGQVVYADWLDGFGMLLVIDHGRGYMSLYGHNQSLLRQVGQSVEQGEPVALVGDSGGQDRPGLYFEIRYQGEAINPTKWLARR